MDNVVRLVLLNAARMIFVGTLLGTFYVTLTWALAIEPAPDAASLAAAQAAADASESAAAEAAAVSEEEAAEETETEGPTVEETVPAEELIALARPSGETTVQILDGGGGADGVDLVRSLLTNSGYRVVAENRSRIRLSTTTIYFTAENEPEAEALRAREPRFQGIEANNGSWSDSVDLHVVVGSDF